MTAPVNILQQVATYQRANLGLLLNYAAFIATANTKFKDFEKITTNLGSTVTFDQPPRFTTTQGLVANFQPAVQRVQTLTVNQSVNTSYEFTAQQQIFNVDKDTDSYMEVFGRSAVAELANAVEGNVALNNISFVVDPTTGLPDPLSGPYRFYGNGITAINSYGQLAQMIANFKNFGAVTHGIKAYLSDVAVPSIVNSGLSQFALDRGNEDAMSWVVGNFGTPPITYYQSNLLPIQNAGTIGNSNLGMSPITMTVVSVTTQSDGGITAITFSTSPADDSDPNAINYGDLLQFNDGVSGYPNMRFLTFVGHLPSAQPVQLRATATAASTSGGHVTVNIFPTLYSAAGQNQNINNPIVAGMQASVLPSHRAGVVIGGDALFLAMPRLPDQFPYATASEYDDDTGVSMRLTYGSLFGQNEMGMIHDCIWGSTMVPDYSMRICFPL